jgi:excisionase family DNA binding protein
MRPGPPKEARPEVALSTPRAAAAVGVSTSVMRRLLDSGVLPCYRINDRPYSERRVAVDDLRDFAAREGLPFSAPASPSAPVPRRHAYTTGQAAAIVHVSVHTVAAWADSGRLASYRIPGSNDRRIPHGELVRFLRDSGMPSFGLSGAAGGVLLLTPDGDLASRLASAVPGCSHARTPFEAGAVSREPVAAALLDFAVGRGDCLSVAGSLRGSHPGIKLVALANEDESEDLSGSGFRAQFSRPADPAALASALAS